jgi:hypothetical protein
MRLAWLRKVLGKGGTKTAALRQETRDIGMPVVEARIEELTQQGDEEDSAPRTTSTGSFEEVRFYPSIVEPLREVRDVSQKEATRRRWFNSDYLDLIVWYGSDGKAINGFQLCYDVGYSERALTWTLDEGYKHNKVDTRRYSTPILVSDGTFQLNAIADIFLKASQDLEPEIAELIQKKLQEYRT